MPHGNMTAVVTEVFKMAKRLDHDLIAMMKHCCHPGNEEQVVEEDD